MLDAVPGRAHGPGPDLGGGLLDPGDDGLDSGVADGVEPGLQPGGGARGHVLGDLLGGEVGVPAVRRVGVRRGQAGGVAAQRAVGEQVPAGAARPELAGAVDAAELAPVADDLHAGLERERGAEVVLAADVGAAALVHRGDAELPGPQQRRLLGGPALAAGDRSVGRAPEQVVGVGADQAVAEEAVGGAGLGDGGLQRAADDRRVHVGAGQVDHPAVRRAVELARRRRPPLGPGRLVPAGAEDGAPAGPAGGVGDAVQGDGQGRRPRQVQPGQRQPRRREVHVRVHEGRRHPGVLEVDDHVGRHAVGGALGPDPGHGGPVDEHSGGEGVGRRADPPPAVERRRHGPEPRDRDPLPQDPALSGGSAARRLPRRTSSRYRAAMTSLLAAPTSAPAPADVHAVLGRSMLVDGFDLVLDLEASRGSRLVDARDGTAYLDLFTFYASSALGMNHPALVEDEVFRGELLQAALNKPANSDVYTVAMARFVQTFARVLGDPGLPHLFFVEGGALAVENALKVAFDWKSRRNEAAGRSRDLGTRVLHLRDAFHGRSGYTLSLTNTDPVKTERFPVFDWPRVPAPYVSSSRGPVERREAEALDAARAAFAAHPHDIACFVLEPVQGEGGDHHFRPEFLQAVQRLCEEHDALLVLDEVQTGCGLTGTAWAFQQLGVQPDVVAFGKKTQVCGVMAGGRVDEVPDNVFRTSSRINSTWGGSLTDMVRSRRILEVVEAEGLIARAKALEPVLLGLLADLAARHPEVTDVRGRGLMCAFSLPDGGLRDAVLGALRDDEHVLLLGCGSRSVRFRPALTVREDELAEGLAALDRVLTRLTSPTAPPKGSTS